MENNGGVMRKTLILAMIFIAIGPFLVMGCSDNDDGNTVVSSDSTLAYIDGAAGFDQKAFLHMTIYPEGGAVPQITEVRFGDSLCEVAKVNNTGIADPMFAVDFNEDASSSMYSDGAQAYVIVSGNGKTSECFLRLLGPANQATISSPSGDTAVLAGSDILIDWNDVDSTDWYAIRKTKVWDSSSVTVTTTQYLYSFVSELQIPNTEVTPVVHFFDVQVVPVTGPSPENTTGNWTGNFAHGKLYSYGLDDQVRVAITGASANKSTPWPESNSGLATPRNIIEGTYAAYRK